MDKNKRASQIGRLFYVRGLGVWVTYTIMITNRTKNKHSKKRNFKYFWNKYRQAI